jgi:adenosylcobyric acid synthase
VTRRARTLMVQGTASTVGKSTLVTGLCRIFADEGLRVAPFKAQNMALNSFVTRDGREMGRAQVVQAEAAGIEPRVEMNPVLLKPEGESRSQVIVMGRPLAALEARDYWRNRSGLLDIVRDALETLRREYDLVIIEGAGSPVELNLARNDIVNMQVARLADAPVLLVGDIDRGGIFAALLGTLMLFPPEDRARVRGLIVNKFRGDLSLWRDGEQMLAERSGLPVLGTLPMFTDITIAEEDSVPLENMPAPSRQQQGKGETTLEIVVVRLPYLSNYDEFDALAAEPSVHLCFAAHPDELPDHPDLVILPGTKSTLHDLAWLWRVGLAAHIRLLAADGCAVFGICGGYQMLGERVSDPIGAESATGTVEPGLDLLPVETVFVAAWEKVTLRTTAQIGSSAARGLFAHLNESLFSAYQIHMGRTAQTENPNGTDAFRLTTGEVDGWIDTSGWVAGCYLHGLYENDAFRHGIIAALAARHAIGRSLPVDRRTFDRQREYDKLAAMLRAHLDIDQIRSISNVR